MKLQSLSKGIFTVVREWKGLLKLERDNSMKLKPKQSKSFYLIQTV